VFLTFLLSESKIAFQTAFHDIINDFCEALYQFQFEETPATEIIKVYNASIQSSLAVTELTISEVGMELWVNTTAQEQVHSVDKY